MSLKVMIGSTGGFKFKEKWVLRPIMDCTKLRADIIPMCAYMCIIFWSFQIWNHAISVEPIYCHPSQTIPILWALCGAHLVQGDPKIWRFSNMSPRSSPVNDLTRKQQHQQISTTKQNVCVCIHITWYNIQYIYNMIQYIYILYYIIYYIILYIILNIILYYIIYYIILYYIIY